MITQTQHKIKAIPHLPSTVKHLGADWSRIQIIIMNAVLDAQNRIYLGTSGGAYRVLEVLEQKALQVKASRQLSGHGKDSNAPRIPVGRA